MSIESHFMDAVAEMGWDDDSQVDILLRFVNYTMTHCGLPRGTFEQFIDNAIEEEYAMTEIDLGDATPVTGIYDGIGYI